MDGKTTPSPAGAERIRLAQKLFRGIRLTLLNRNLCQRGRDGATREVEFSSWIYLPEERAIIYLVNVDTLPVPKEKLENLQVARQISTALDGRRVHIANHRGLGYMVAIDEPPLQTPTARQAQRLPRQIDLDLSQRPAEPYMLGVGVDDRGVLWLSLEKACHIMVGGSSDSGKSTFLRSLLYQLMVMPAPVQVVLVDMEGRTFSAFRDLPRVRFPVAANVSSATHVTTWLEAEMERRGQLFDIDAGHSFPETLEEYHATLQARHGAIPDELRLPRIVAVFDELTALLDAAGKRSTLYRNIGQLSMRSRKYGITLVYAGQDFKSDLIDSRITNQAKTRLAFRCATRFQSQSIIGQSGAEKITLPGRAWLSLYGSIHETQTFWLDKAQIVALHRSPTTSSF